MHCQCKGNQARTINTPCFPYTRALQPGLHPSHCSDTVTFWLSLTGWVTSNLWDVLLEKFPSESRYSNYTPAVCCRGILKITWGFAQNLLATPAWFPQSSDTSAQLAQTDRAYLVTRMGTKSQVLCICLTRRQSLLHPSHLTANWTQLQALKLPEKWTFLQRTVDTASRTTSFCLLCCQINNQSSQELCK